jgi:methanethiol S-methyltransferase
MLSSLTDHPGMGDNRVGFSTAARGLFFLNFDLAPPASGIPFDGAREFVDFRPITERRKDPMSILIQVALVACAWCFFHSLFITHRWRALVRRTLPRHHLLNRFVYVFFSTASLGLMAWWFWSLPAQPLWSWTGWWSFVRWAALLDALLLFWLGVRSYDGKAFLGLRQWRDWLANREPREPPFRASGILGMIRHPWYTGTLLFLIFCLPFTDVNLVWRGVFFLYTIIGTELEERKLLVDVGVPYEEYRTKVPRFFPGIRRR